MAVLALSKIMHTVICRRFLGGAARLIGRCADVLLANLLFLEPTCGFVMGIGVDTATVSYQEAFRLHP